MSDIDQAPRGHEHEHPSHKHEVEDADTELQESGDSQNQTEDDCIPCREEREHAEAASMTAGPSKLRNVLATAQAESAAAPAATIPSTTTPPHPADIAAAPISAPTRRCPAVTIEYCDRCRWAPRASWIQTELFLTFPPPHIQQITLIPLVAPETGGRFRVWLDMGRGNGDQLIWDRKSEGGFPELKALKQRVRDQVQPDRGLGHSDSHPKAAAAA